LAFPIDYQWCLCGTVLQEGEGSVTSTTGTLSYKLEGRRLTIESEMAQDISCELCVSAIGARDRELFTCIQLQKPGIDRQCRRCEPRRNFHIEYLPALEDLTGWRPLIAHAAPGRQVS
ncbi:MAG TPA: hypothetical protein VMO47_13635, partial [Rhodothermales bacterium]|nr:hypothetical protein [Rhodothermales bacterium]